MDFARDQKRELGCQWKEGDSIAQKTSGEWMACPRQILPPLTLGNKDKTQTWGGSPRTLLPPNEAVAPSNLKADRSLEAVPPGLQDRWGQPHCLWDIGQEAFRWLGTSQRGESLSGYPACPYPSPRGRPPAPPSSAPASQPARENPVVRLPHPCENPDASVPILFSTRFLQGPWHASPSLSWRT